MGQPLQPGELVVRRVRWHKDAALTGIVIGNTYAPLEKEPPADEVRTILVMWTTDDNRIKFTWHLPDALMVVKPENLAELRSRCDLAS